jgi:hypothetical protein
MNVFVQVMLVRFDDADLSAEIESAIDCGSAETSALLHVLRSDDVDSDDWEIQTDPAIIVTPDKPGRIAISPPAGPPIAIYVDPTGPDGVNLALETAHLHWTGTLPKAEGWVVYRPAPDALLIVRAVSVTSEEAFARITAPPDLAAFDLDTHRGRQRALQVLLSGQ